MTLSKENIWNDAVSFTREKSPGSFEQWFSGVQFEGLTEGVLCLRARDEFVREWVERHFMPTLTDFLRAQTGLSIQVAWSVGGELTRPVAEAPIVTPRPRPLRPSHPPAPPLGSASSALGGGSNGSQTGPGPNGSPAGAGRNDDSDPRDGSSQLTMSGQGSPFASSHGPGQSQGYSGQGQIGQGPSSRQPQRAGLKAAAAPVEGLNPKYTFENFVIGPSNQLAHAAAVAAAGGNGPRHNPLFLCGGTGLGKTHLVHAVAHRIRLERPQARILYLSAEKFVNEFLQALQDQRMNDFRARYREKCDLLLVDDIQFFANKTQTQEEFFHAFNALHQADKQIIVTSDKYPQQLERMEERLVSRFSWGLVADIQGPELETRVAILRKKAQIENIELSDEIVLYLAQAVRSNVRELEGTLIRIAAKSSLLQRPVDFDFVRAELLHTSGPRASEQGVEDIQRVVCHHFKLRSADLLSKDRHKSIAFARHVAMYLCKQRLKCSFPELGRAFGNRDHTTVMSAVRKVNDLRTSDPEVRAHLDALERKLGSLD